MGSEKNKIQLDAELRQDPVFGDWILLAPIRGKRHKFEGRIKFTISKNRCPFENPSKFGNKPPVLVYQNSNNSDWFLQVIPNKYPAVMPIEHGYCGSVYNNGLYKFQPGVGFHEIIIMRDHDRYLADYSVFEIEKIVTAYKTRYSDLAKEKCVKYISIFHNHGKEAGSTVPHLHSQILALPIVPPDVNHSINGSRRYSHKYKKCIHCQLIKQELKERKRIIYENKDMVVITPFASKVNFETRIFPKNHLAYFEKIKNKELTYFAEAMKFVFSRLDKKLKDPAFNFFIHTAPTAEDHDYDHYHWHMEILPRFQIIGSVELGTGLNIVSIIPEEAAKILRE